MKVIANKKGFYGKIRLAGDEFDIKSKKQLGKWMTVAEKPVEKPVEKL